MNGVLYSAVFTYEIGRIVNARETRIYLLESFIPVYITCKLVRQKNPFVLFTYLFILKKCNTAKKNTTRNSNPSVKMFPPLNTTLRIM